MDNKKEILIVFPNFKIEEYQLKNVLFSNKTPILPKALATPLVGHSEENPGYQKPISLAHSVWESIKKAGGTCPSPFVINNSTTKAFIKPECKQLHGPGQILDHKTPIALLPGESIYGCIDGLNTLQNGDQVFKVVDGVKVIILSDGNVKVIHYKNWISRIGQWWRGGWKDRRKRSSWVALSEAFTKDGSEVNENSQR